MSRKRFNLGDYEWLLCNYEPSQEDGIMQFQGLTKLGLNVKLSKLRLSQDGLCESDMNIIDNYYPLIHDGVIFLLPHLSIEEVHSYADKEANSAIVN